MGFASLALDIPNLYYLAPIAAVAALLTARVLQSSVLKRSEGDAEMIRIAAAVRAGAMAYLARQYRVVFMVFIGLVGLLALLWMAGLQPKLTMIGVPLAGFLSGLCGWFGMRMATSASARTTAAAKQSLNEGLQVAFRAGAVMGLNVVGFALLDVSFWFFVLSRFGQKWGLLPSDDSVILAMTTVMLSFGMGASTQALFARVGGGIYTKAADVGADLVGKVEAGIPEDDPRNPATIADNVGDNVGDVAGMGADLYESYYGSIMASIALGAAAAFAMHDLGEGVRLKLDMLLAAAPIALAGFGILASIVGIYSVRTREDATFGQLLKSLHGGVYLASVIIAVAAFLVPYLLMGPTSVAAGAGIIWWRLGLAITAGLVCGLVIAQWTEYCTSYEHAPTRRIAQQALTGPATVIIAGIAEGMKSTWASLLAVVVAILVAFISAGGNESMLLGLYGVAIAAVGMLSTLGITLATDAYGPIADNAGGNAEMSGQPPAVRQRTDMLDSLGNTTAATGKGFAIGSAALTALALLASYVQIVHEQLHHQAVQQAMVATAPPGLAEDRSYAQYLGARRFAIVLRDEMGNKAGYDGGIIADRSQLTGELHFAETVKAGQSFALLKPDEEHGHNDVYVARILVPHGGHDHEYELRLAPMRTATIEQVLTYYDVTLTNPRVLGGLFMGVMLTFLFCALTMNAVGRAAYAMMNECRRQFALIRRALRDKGMSDAEIADPEQWPKRIEHEGVEYPDYARCVAISTAGAQREMIVPSLLAIAVPVLVGVLLDVPGVLGLLAGGLTSGFAVAVFMANAGGAWDNAKKLIESYGKMSADHVLDNAAARDRLPEEIRDTILARAEELRRTGKGSSIVYGKGSDDHKATVVGDTVGDPFKDTSGPSLNILIKLISIVSVVAAGFVVKFAPSLGGLIGLN